MREDESPAVAYENLDDEELEQRRESRGCAWFWLVSFLVAIVFVSLPVLRTLPSDDRNDPDTARRDARRFVAQQFATDALEHRSTRRAVEWVVPELHADVDEIVGYLQSREPAVLEGAELSVAASTCGARSRGDAECFHAWLYRAGRGEVIRIRFDVAIVDGRARVVDVAVIQTLQSPPPAVAGAPAKPSPRSGTGAAWRTAAGRGSAWTQR
jgi:hypothetical protein